MRPWNQQIDVAAFFVRATAAAVGKGATSLIPTAMYYGKIFADPKDVDRVYVMNVFLMVSDDGGRTLRRLGERSKHVDNHVIWINPANTDHYLVGCDGGVYESYDRGAFWHFKSNLPITQFYDITTDNATPFL